MNTTHKIKLISKQYAADSIGNMVETFTTREVFANLKSISSKEFFDAGTDGLKPDKKFVMRGFEYRNEDEIVFGDVKYSIYRTYARDDGFIELYTEKKVGNQ